MSDDNASGTTIKYHESRGAPWSTPKGTVEERKQQIAEEFGLSTEGKTLHMLTVEATIHARALWTAATGVGREPDYGDVVKAWADEPDKTDDEGAAKPAPVKKAAPKKQGAASRAAKKKAEAPEAQEPAEVSDSLEAKVASAPDGAALVALYKANKADWNDELTALAKARREALGEDK